MRVLSLISAAVAFATMALATVDAASLDQNVKLYGVNYDMQQPKQDWEVDADLAAIAQVAKSVRVYGLSQRADHSVARLLTKAKAKGLTVALGMWLDKNDWTFPSELANLEVVLKAGLIDGNVVGFHVGSEAIYRKDYSADTAIKYLNAVRDMFKKYNVPMKITIADVVDSYYQNPQLLSAVDYVSINQFSMWEKAEVGVAMTTMLDRIRSIRTQATSNGNKAVLISETGWSSGGYDNRTSATTPENQKQFFQDFYHQATAHELPYYWFVAFDATWMSTTDPNISPVERYFGMMNQDRSMKASFTGLNLKQRTIATFQTARGGFLAETFNPQAMEQVTGVEAIAAPTTKLTTLRAQWFYDATKGQLRSVNSNRCLDAYEPKNGGIVHTYTCMDNERNQKFTYDTATLQLKHAIHTGFCVEDRVATKTVELWSCDAANVNQRWGMNGAPVVKESTFIRLFTKEMTQNGQLGGFAQLVRSGENVGFAFSPVGAAGSEWTYDATTKLLRAKDSTVCLDAYEAWSGGRVHVWECNAQEKNQQWNYDASTGQFRHASHAGFCLDGDLAANNGAGNAQLWGCHLNNNNQVWRTVSSSATSVRLTNTMDASVVELVTQDELLGKPLTKADAQSWFWNPFKGTLLSKWNGECLDAYEPQQNGRVHTWGCIAGEGNQQWKLDGGLLKHSKHTGYCLAYASAATKQLVLKSCSASDATQQFALAAISA